MKLDSMRLEQEAFEWYRAVIDIVADWDLLAQLAEWIHRDPQLRPSDRDRLLTSVDAREPWIRPDWVRSPSG